jgi:hypothetical protein
MQFTLRCTQLAKEQLASIPQRLRQFVKNNIEQLASNPRPSTSVFISTKDFQSFLLDVPSSLKDIDLAEEDELRKLCISKGKHCVIVGYVVRPSQGTLEVLWICTEKTYGKAITQTLKELLDRHQAGRRSTQ